MTTMQHSNPPRRPPGGPSRRDEAAFSMWLREALHEVFDESAITPISSELAALLEANRRGH